MCIISGLCVNIEQDCATCEFNADNLEPAELIATDEEIEQTLLELERDGIESSLKSIFGGRRHPLLYWEAEVDE